MQGIVLKLDFEKAYDKVNWRFMIEVLWKKNFPEKWVEWMKQIIEGGKVGININGEVGHFFNTYKGLRKGDPLSPLLFNLVSDALATMLSNAKTAGEIKGLVPHLIEGGITHLQYADDTVIFLNMDDQSIIYTKILLYCFENMFGLKINYKKSKVFALGCSEEETTRVAQMLNCNIGHLSYEVFGGDGTQQTHDSLKFKLCSNKSREKSSNMAECGAVLSREDDISGILFEFSTQLHYGGVCFAGGDPSKDGQC
jgi:hypothetical protein